MTIVSKDIREDIDLMQSLIQEPLTEMAIADKDELGFPYFVYLSSKEFGHKYVRVKFAEKSALLKTKNSFVVIILENGDTEIWEGVMPDSELAKKALLWVKQNKDVITQYWDDPTSFGTTKDFLKQLIPL